MCPIAGGDRGYSIGRCDQGVPGAAARLDDSLVGLPDAVAQEILPEEFPDVFHWVEFRSIGWQRHQGDVLGNIESSAGLVPAGAVENEDGVGAWPNALADLFEVQVHSLGTDGGQNEGRAGASVRTHGAKQIDRAVPLIAWCRRPGSSPRPQAGQRSPLGDPRVVLAPDLERLADRPGRGGFWFQAARNFFFFALGPADLARVGALRVPAPGNTDF